MSVSSALFSDTYTEARQRFLAAATARGAALQSHENEAVRGPAGDRLFTDVAVLAPPQADCLLLLVSGTHGVEGYAGSAIQSRLLAEGSPLPEDIAVVMVHALNPFGFAHDRRVNEDNVDLNRNFVDHADPPANDDYALVHQSLLPDDWDGPGRQAADARIGEMLNQHGIRFVQTAITRGQYTHPDGLFFGGRRPVWSNHVLRRIFAEHTAGFRRVAYIDLHTGLGPRGHGEPIFRGGRDAGARERAQRWYGAALTDSEAGTSSSTPIIGNTASALADALAEDVELTAITLEFGTEPGLVVLNALRADNWLYLRGDPEGAEAPPIKALMREAFRPDDDEWRQAVMVQADRFIELAHRGLQAED